MIYILYETHFLLYYITIPTYMHIQLPHQFPYTCTVSAEPMKLPTSLNGIPNTQHFVEHHLAFTQFCIHDL